MGESVHSGHRKRMRALFKENGYDFRKNTSSHLVLEMILFYSIPRKDTNELSHKLLKHFKSLSGILDAPAEELMQFDGISENTVTLLKMFIPVARIYREEKNNKNGLFHNLDEIGSFLVNRYFGYNDEVFSVCSLKSNGQLISYDVLMKGDISSVGISTRQLIESVLKNNASCVVIAHNHPDGLALPSSADIRTTVLINDALKHIGVKLLDHIIISGDDYVSLALSEKYRSIFQ